MNYIFNFIFIMVRQRFHGKHGQYCACATSTNLEGMTLESTVYQDPYMDLAVYYRKNVALSRTSSPQSFKIPSLGMLSNYKKGEFFVGIQNQESGVLHVSDLRD